MVAKISSAGIKRALPSLLSSSSTSSLRLHRGAMHAWWTNDALGGKRPLVKPGSWMVLGYVGVAVACAGLAAVVGRNPFVTPAWLGTTGLTGAMLSAGLGATIGAATIAATRALARRAVWIRALHTDLRPVVRGEGTITLVAMAVASGVGEEILFRGLLVPAIGVVASALAFGAIHQVRGRARWAWMAWAALMGLLFALLFECTGSLLGPIVAHVYVNACNLRFLRDHNLEPKRARRLGGLLDRDRNAR